MTDKAQTIINETICLVAENGFHGSPASLIAKRANVGTGTIYRYFAGKAELIVRAKEYILSDLDSKLVTPPETLPFKERYTGVLSSLMSYFLENETYYRFFEQYLHSPFGQGQVRLARKDNPFELLCNEAKQRGVIRDLPNAILFALSVGPILFMLEEHFCGTSTVDETVIRTVVTSAWNAIKV